MEKEESSSKPLFQKISTAFVSNARPKLTFDWLQQGNSTIRRHGMPFGIGQLTSDAIAVLDEISELGEDWDGYGGVAISERAYTAATTYLLSLPSGLPAPEIVPSTRGNINFLWEHEDTELSIHVAIDSNGNSRYFAQSPSLGAFETTSDGRFLCYDTEFLPKTLPPNAILQRFFALLALSAGEEKWSHPTKKSS